MTTRKRQVGPTQRADDPGGITIDRKIPLWGVILVAGTIAAQAVVMWNGQSLQAAEMRHQSEQIAEMATQVKGLALKVESKDGKDVDQDALLRELGRRLFTVEGQLEARKK